ncbi:MAG: ABC transporter substrate-binding protein [Bullifex sp.]
MRKLLIVICSVLMLFGCSGKKTDSVSVPAENVRAEQKADERVGVTIYMYDVSPMKQLTPYLTELFPDVDISVVTAVNDIKALDYLSSKGELYDIILLRRFSLNDTKNIRDQLLDLSRTEVAARFHSSILDQNRDEDGSVKWLPSAAEIDGIIANRSLFEKCGLSLPTDYESFANACTVLSGNGIIPVSIDWKYDYTCLELLQAASLSRLTAVDGVAWRQRYESEKEGDPVGLDRELWLPVFDNLMRFLDDTLVPASDFNKSLTNVNKEFLAGDAAMMRGTSDVCRTLIDMYGIDAVMLPYFGERERDNWLLTYPTFQVAVNKKVADDPAKYEAVINILNAMFSEEGERHTAAGVPMLSYTTVNRIVMPEYFSEIQPQIDSNHLYMRLASTKFFQVSHKVVQKMVAREYASPEDAFDAFNELLTSDAETPVPEVAFTNDTYVPYGMTENGNMAENALLSTLKDRLWFESGDHAIHYAPDAEGLVQADVAVAFSGLLNWSLFEGGYTAAETGWLASPRKGISIAELTGEEIDALMKELVDVRADGSNPIPHINMIPVASGFSYRISDTGNGTFSYIGSDLEKDRTYRIMVVGNMTVLADPAFSGAPLSEGLKSKLFSTKGIAATVLPIMLKMPDAAFSKAVPYLSFE